MYVSNNISYSLVSTQGSAVVDSRCVRLQLRGGYVNVLLIYCPPHSTSHLASYLESLFQSTKICTSDTLILGDMNIDWLTSTSKKLTLSHLLSLYNFKQHITTPTRVTSDSKTLVDLLFSNTPRIKHSGVSLCDISDHYLIHCKVACKPHSSHKPPNDVYKRDFSKYNPFEFFEHAKYLNFHKTEDIQCPHEATHFLENLIKRAVDKFAPFKSFKAKKISLPYNDPELSNIIKEKRQLFKDYKKSGKGRDSDEWKSYKVVRNKSVAAIRKAKADSYRNIIEDKEVSMWDKIRKIKGCNSNSPDKISEIIHNGTNYQSPKDIAHILNTYFSTIGTKLNSTTSSKICPNDYQFKNHQSGFSFSQVDSTIVSSTLRSLKNRKTGGVDQIPSFIYQELEPLIISPLTYVINLAISKNEFPDCWKTALVIPLYKKENPKMPGNYRPISLLPVLGKVFEKVLAFQMNLFFESHQLFNSRQFGFRKHCSTDQLVFQLCNMLKLKLSEKESKFATVAALDIKKAFDSVNHQKLLQKCNSMFNFNISSTLLLKNYLSHRTQHLKYKNIISSAAKVTTGVPQGSVLGPLLFLIFINDLMNLENCYLFADDCLVVNYGHNINSSTSNMENNLNQYNDWYNENSLVINAAKTEIMTVTLSNIKRTDIPPITFKGNKIKQVDHIKYLGCFLDKELNFKKHTSSMKRKLYPIIQNFMRCIKHLSSSIAASYYKCLIRPILEYCGPVLATAGKTVIKDIMAIENRCLKIISNQSKKKTRLNHNIPSIDKRINYLYLLAYYKLTHKQVPRVDDSILPNYVSTCTRLGVSGGFLLGSKSAIRTTLNFGASMYNALPQQIRSLPFYDSFKTELRAYIMTFDDQQI